MQQRKAAVTALAVAALVLSACSDERPTEPHALADESALFFGGGTPDPSTFSNSLDSRFVQLADRYPGFGGYFYGEDGALNVYMAGASPVSAALGRDLSAMGVDLRAQPVRVLAADYDFRTLNQLHSRAGAVLALGGVVYTDANEAINRVEIGVEHAAARANVEHALGMLGVPLEAVNIREVEPIRFMQPSLQAFVRPVAGGLQINFPGFLCTLGFNVRSPAAPNVHGFVTNSHCTNSQWQFNPGAPTPYAQPSGVALCPGGNCIAFEAHDAPGFTAPAMCHNVPCPAGRICRNSDAAGARYLEGVPNAFARIYRTLGINSLNIDASNPMWHIVAAAATNQPVGTTIHKTGRTTGWSSGSVTSSCANTNVGGTNFTTCCQDIVTGPAGSVGGGDSGSGTFRRLGVGADVDIELTGILWGGSGSTVFVYSPLERIRMDNPPPPGFPEWNVHPPPFPP